MEKHNNSDDDETKLVVTTLVIMLSIGAVIGLVFGLLLRHYGY